MYGVNWRVDIKILATSQSFPKCSDFNICAEKLKQKSVIHQLKTKERVVLILSEVGNNFKVYNYTSTTILLHLTLIQSQNIAISGFIFLVTWQMRVLKM